MAFISPCKPVISVIAALDELLAAAVAVPLPPPQLIKNKTAKTDKNFIILPKNIFYLTWKFRFLLVKKKPSEEGFF